MYNTEKLTADVEEEEEEGVKDTGGLNTNSFAVGSSLKFFIALEKKRESCEQMLE